MENKTITLHTRNKLINLNSQVLKYRLLIAYSLLLILIGICSETPQDLWTGTVRIFTSPSNLLTDYFAVGNFGSAFYCFGIFFFR
jgi:hypothetical protein